MSDKDAREEALGIEEAKENVIMAQFNDLADSNDLRGMVRITCGNYYLAGFLAAESQRTPRELADRYNENVGQILERTQAPSETRTKLLKIAARVARREYVPSLEKCRTISDARAEVRRMDDLHAQLAWELKTVLDALAGTQAQAAQSSDEEPFHGSVMCDGPS